MTKIKFGTDGWRSVIAKDFTVENVARISEGASKWLIEKNDKLSVVIGHDCRFGGPLFAEAAAKIFLKNNIKVFLTKGFVTTPMISMGALKLETGLGVIITASHNPYTDNGYKLKGHYGGPLMENDIHDVEKLIPDKSIHDTNNISLEEFEKKGMLEYVDLEKMYCDYLEEKFDLDLIRNSEMNFAFDAMYGSGQSVMRRLFPDITLLHCEHNPLFDYIPPEPLLRNLGEMAETIKLAEDIDCGLAVDGDADRIALFNKKGDYIDSHHTLLILIHYLNKHKGLDGKVATGFSSTQKIKKLCKLYNLPLEIVKIGFKHICGLMLNENILVGGEESGGIAVAGHIPERDGIYNGILIWEFLAKSGKSLQDVIDEIYKLTGAFAFERSDLRIQEEDKQRIIKNCEKGIYKSFGKYKVKNIETLDGFKFYFNDDEWLMIRPSGTEPVLRTYAESYTKEDALAILKAGYDTIMEK